MRKTIRTINIKYLIFPLLILISCCEKKTEEPLNENLLFFKSQFIGELGNDNSENLLAKTRIKIKAKYIDDVIFVSNYVETNACGNYIGNIEIKNDTINLILKLVSDEVCTSTGVEKLTYIINNPKEKKYIFKMK